VQDDAAAIFVAMESINQKILVYLQVTLQSVETQGKQTQNVPSKAYTNVIRIKEPPDPGI
jgi:hypothetical protein